MLKRTSKMDSRYKNPDNDPRGVWTSGDISVKRVTEKDIYQITTPSGRKVSPPLGRSWAFSKEKFEEYIADNRIWFGDRGDNVPRIKRFLTEVKDGVVAQTIWMHQEVGHNQDAKKEIKSLFEGQAIFGTPKPEKLLQRIIHLGSNEGDIVLDFFMGSATTQAVAHKMKRQYIGIEQMDYIKSVSVERMKKVIAGEQGGISKNVNWNGGGEFLFCELKNDALDFRNNVINAVSSEELIKLLNLAKKSSFLSYRIDSKKLKEKEFLELSFSEQKQLLLETVDNNNLYVNYTDIDDEKYKVSEEDKKLNREFYGE